MAKNSNKTPEDFLAFGKVFKKESDRAAALLAAAYLDVQLEALFQARVVTGAPERGLPRSFSARIDIAFSIGWISPSAYADLRQIRDIRNIFAHRADHELAFEAPELRASVEELNGPRIFNQLLGEIDGLAQITGCLVSTTRERFDLAFAFLRAYLIHELAVSKRIPVRSDRVTLNELYFSRFSPSRTSDGV